MSDSDDPGNFEEDKPWLKWAVNKFVYFRWSTAHNSKNRFKGIVTGHKSRQKNSRIDFLLIKTFGYSEDEYVMGKDIREMYVLPKKSILLQINNDQDARKFAIKKWSCKNGWESGPFEPLSVDVVSAATSVSVPSICVSAPIKTSVSAKSQSASAEPVDKDFVRTALAKPVDYVRTAPSKHDWILQRYSQNQSSATTSASSSPRITFKKKTIPSGHIRIIGKHTAKSMAARLKGFSFGHKIISN